MKQRIVITGDAQAQALAELLQAIPPLQDRYDIAWIAALAGDQRCEVLCMQTAQGAEAQSVPEGARVIRFPHMRFNLLWPLTSVNFFDAAEPPLFPHGRFPYGDGYVGACVKQNVSPADILPFSQSATWPVSWPSVDELYATERERLVALDGACDVPIAAFIFDNFAGTQLFHAVNAPSAALLTEIALRLASVILGETNTVDLTCQRAPGAEPLATVQVPIHPYLVERFSLRWYDPSSHRYFTEQLSREDYFRRMIAHSYFTKAHRDDPTSPLRLIVYGNCQAEAVASIVRGAEIDGLQVLYLASFTEPGAAAKELDLIDVAQCDVLWEQHDEVNPFPYARWLAPKTLRLRFPAADFNALWPLTCTNPYARPMPPKYPFGRFAYGDRALLSLVEQGTDAAQIFETFGGESERRLPNLERMLALEEARLRARDAKCDITLADVVLENFRQKRLFWTVNHPSSELLALLTRRLIDASTTALPLLGTIDEQRILRERFPKSGPLGVSSVPIHPAVARGYGLEWYDPKKLFANWGDLHTYEGYFRAMIEDSLEARSATSDVAR